jgi:hypothetical protein
VCGNFVHEIEIIFVDRKMNAPHINAQQSKSDTLYIRGISRRVTDEELLHKILNQVEDPVETDLLSKRNSGVIWARYGSLSTAHRTMLKIHQSIWFVNFIFENFRNII